MNNDQVRNAQFILKSLGYAPGREDGYYSAATATAVRAFQHAAGLTANGQIDEKQPNLLKKKSLSKEIIRTMICNYKQACVLWQTNSAYSLYINAGQTQCLFGF